MACLIWTEPALTDLEIIADYIALDKPDAAKRYMRRVLEAVDRSGQFPNSGSVPPEMPDLPYRQVVVPPCRIFYRAEKENVFILYVMRSDQLFREEMLEERKRKRSSPPNKEIIWKKTNRKTPALVSACNQCCKSSGPPAPSSA